MFQVTRLPAPEEVKWKALHVKEGSWESGYWGKNERRAGVEGLNVLAFMPLEVSCLQHCSIPLPTEGRGIYLICGGKKWWRERSYYSNNRKWGREERRKSGNERQSKGQKPFDVELLWLWWEAHLYCSGALCLDLKRADLDNPLEFFEAYFLIKEHRLLETMTMGLAYCLPCQFI